MKLLTARLDALLACVAAAAVAAVAAVGAVAAAVAVATGAVAVAGAATGATDADSADGACTCVCCNSSASREVQQNVYQYKTRYSCIARTLCKSTISTLQIHAIVALIHASV
jgi:hypothetical protein